MSNQLTDAIACLKRARDVLLAKSQEAGGEGNWETAKMLIHLAERADRLGDDIPAAMIGSETRPSKKVAAPAPTVADEPPPVLSSLPGVYPQYLVRGGNLVKRGLQRNGHDVYEHSVPQEWYDQILDRVAQMAKAVGQGKQRPFSIDQIQRGMTCPRYMTYVVVSLFLREALIVRVRKGSYNFAEPATFAGQAAALWEQLQEKGAS